MTFRLTEEQQAIRNAVREFGENEIRPVAHEFDERRAYPEALRRKAAEYDLVAPTIPEEYGGAGMDLLSSVIVTEELWRADPGIGSAIGSAGLGTSLLVEYGDEPAKESWLPRITAGETVSANAVSEPAHGSNVAGIETQARREGDGWVIDGRKTWITNATVADIVLVFAKTDRSAGKRGISVFIVPTDTPGFEAEAIDNKLGIRAADLGELFLDGVRVPASHLVGEENRGFYQLMEFFASGRVNVAAQAVGAAQAALDAALGYADEREQFGQPIREFQAIRHKVAEMATSVEAARSLAYRAAEVVAAGDEARATRFASIAKLFASERAVEVADEAIQIHGGAGYVSDHPVERYYRDARVTKLYEGTSEIQKNIIADGLL